MDIAQFKENHGHSYDQCAFFMCPINRHIHYITCRKVSIIENIRIC